MTRGGIILAIGGLISITTDTTKHLRALGSTTPPP
jgi:hypothetical protein